MLGVVRSGTGRRFGALALGWAVVLVLVASPAAATPTPQRAAPFHLEEATIDSIHGALRAGQLTCRGLVQLYLDRIAAYNHDEHDLNAVQTVNPAALDEAARLDVQRAAGVMAGPLHCIPVLVKDQVETSDMPTTYGSVLFRDFVPERDASVVERLKGAGAIILAKTTMGEFAASYAGSGFGICRNAYDPAREPAGSSCGTGIAVAANFGTVGIGEDTLGSVRNPAARASLVGLRPTVPVVSRFGMMPATPTQDTLGPMARTVRDTALLLDVIAGYDPNDPVTAASVGHVPPTYASYLDANGLRGMRLGILRQPMAENTNPDAADFAQVRGVLDRALGEMAAGGAVVVDPVTIPGLRELLRRSSAGEFEAEAAVDRYLSEHPSAPVHTLREIVMAPEVLGIQRARLIEALGHTRNDPGYLQLILARDELRQAVLSAMADYGVDALVYASVDHHPEIIPADILTMQRRLSALGPNRALAAFIGFPAIVVPGGFADGLPVGIEILGRAYSEGDLLKIAYSYEQATLHRRPPWTTPPLPGEP